MYTVTRGLCFTIASILLAIFFAYFSPIQVFKQPANMQKFKYPEARRDDTVVDDFHGTKVRKFL